MSGRHLPADSPAAGRCSAPAFGGVAAVTGCDVVRCSGDHSARSWGRPPSSAYYPGADPLLCGGKSRSRGSRIHEEVDVTPPTANGRRSQPSTGTKVAAGVLCLIPVVALMLVPTYTRKTPR